MAAVFRLRIEKKMTDEDFFVLAKDLRPEKKNEKVAILQVNNFLVEYRPGEKKVPFDPTSFKKLTAADTGPHPKYFMKNGDDLLRYAILAVNSKLPEVFFFFLYCLNSKR